MAKYCGTGLNTFMYLLFNAHRTLRKPTQNEKP